MAVPDLNVFGNAGRSGYEDIVRAGPGWWTEYLEMDVNYRFAGWTLDLMAYHLDRVLNNLFFRHADEETIRRIEEFLKITYGDLDVSLDERRSTVEAYFTGTGKLSGSVIRSIVLSYTGMPSEVWTDSRRINVRIITDDIVKINAGLLYGIIGRRIPAHMEYILKISKTTEMQLCAGVASQYYEKRTVSTDEKSPDGYTWYGSDDSDIYIDEENSVYLT